VAGSVGECGHGVRGGADPSVAGWGVAMNIECAKCGFSGPEHEFMAVGQDDDGVIHVLMRDDSADVMVPVCSGCIAAIGRQMPAVVRVVLWRLLLREVGEVLDDAEAAALEQGLDPDEPIPYELTFAAKVVGL
jgi:hypothetical protein